MTAQYTPSFRWVSGVVHACGPADRHRLLGDVRDVATDAPLVTWALLRCGRGTERLPIGAHVQIRVAVDGRGEPHGGVLALRVIATDAREARHG